MRTVTYGGACSLDGFITGPNEAMDWLHFSRDVSAITAKYWRSIDTLVMGRRTWEFGAKQFDSAPGMDQPMTTYVFSRTLRTIDHPRVTLVASDPGAFVRDLKRRPGKGICVLGGSDFARALFAADVVDEVGFSVHPVLLGSGVPALRDAGRRIQLELREARPIHGGCVYLLYRVKRARSVKSRGSRSAA